MKDFDKLTTQMNAERTETIRAAKAVLTMYGLACPDGDYLLHYHNIMNQVSRLRRATLPANQTPTQVLRKYLTAHTRWTGTKTIVQMHCSHIEELRETALNK